MMDLIWLHLKLYIFQPPSGYVLKVAKSQTDLKNIYLYDYFKTFFFNSTILKVKMHDYIESINALKV